MTFEEKTISSEVLYEGRIVTLRKDHVTTVSGTSTREIVEHVPCVAMVALKPDGKVVLIHQFRKPLDRVVTEIPAGMIEPGEEPQAAAVRELKEETGYTAGHVRFLTELHPTVGYCTEKISVYLMTDLTAGETDFDPNEAIDSEEVPIEEAEERILRGEMSDAKALVGIMMTAALIRRGELKEYLK